MSFVANRHLRKDELVVVLETEFDRLACNRYRAENMRNTRPSERPRTDNKRDRDDPEKAEL